MDAKGISAAIVLVQKAIDLGKKATHLDYEEALLAAREAIAFQRDENLKIREENHDLKVENEKLKKQQETEVNVEFAEDAYWQRMPDGKWQGPFCNACWVNHKKLMPLSYREVGSVVWNCPSCKANYGWSIKKHHPQDRPPQARVEPLQIQ